MSASILRRCSSEARIVSSTPRSRSCGAALSSGGVAGAAARRRRARAGGATGRAPARPPAPTRSAPSPRSRPLGVPATIVACLESVAMIGMPRQNGKRPVELLGRHRPDQLMRPSHGAEADYFVRFAAQGRVEPVGSADRQRIGRDRAVAGPADLLGPLAAGQRRAALVEQRRARRLWGRRRESSRASSAARSSARRARLSSISRSSTAAIPSERARSPARLK